MKTYSEAIEWAVEHHVPRAETFLILSVVYGVTGKTVRADFHAEAARKNAARRRELERVMNQTEESAK